MYSQRQDGSVVSAALTGSRYRNSVEKDYGMYRGMVLRVFFTDDKGNLTFNNKQVTYDVILLGGRKEGQEVLNVRAASPLGGQYNYHERVYRATEFAFSGPTKKPLSEQNGDIVYIQFVNGNTSLPVIIGSGVSPLDKDTTGATKADGHIWREQYNGIKRVIDRDGNLTLERFGGEWQKDAGYFKPSEEALITEKYSEQKKTTSYKSGMSITEDGEAEKLSINMPSGTLIDVDGVGGLITIDTDGGTNQIKIDKSGEVTITASSKVSLKAPLVDVGEGAAFSSTLFENLLSEFAKHTHQAPQAPAGVLPTTPPIAPLISLVGSQSIKVKD